MSISRAQLEADVLAILRDHVPEEVTIDPTSTMVGHLGLDSIALMEAIAEMEDRFGVHISEDCLRDVKTVDDVLKMLEQKLGARGGIS
ncbi:MAG: phosphopantetheine-binding protein [Polyangiaceae bacterium]